MTTPDQLRALADRCEAAMGANNRLDVEIEIAMFRPGSVYSAVRSNSAGTKVIYIDLVGNEVTCWAEDWTLGERRLETEASLRARAASMEEG